MISKQIEKRVYVYLRDISGSRRLLYKAVMDFSEEEQKLKLELEASMQEDIKRIKPGEDPDLVLLRALRLSALEARSKKNPSLHTITTKRDIFVQNQVPMTGNTAALNVTPIVDSEIETSDEAEDEVLKQAIAMSLETGPIKKSKIHHEYIDSTSVSNTKSEDMDKATRRIIEQIQKEDQITASQLQLREVQKGLFKIATNPSRYLHGTRQMSTSPNPDALLPAPHLGSNLDQPRFLDGRVGFTYCQQYPRVGYFKLEDLIQPQFIKDAVLAAMVVRTDWLLHYFKGAKKMENLVFISHFAEKSKAHKVADMSQQFGFNTSIVELARDGSFGSFHSKFMFFRYDKYLRVVITSANLYAGDWELLENVLFVQDFPLKANDSSGTSLGTPSEFLTSFVEFIKILNLPTTAGRVCVDALLKRYSEDYDFSNAKGVILASVKGSFDCATTKWGHVGLAKAVKSFNISFDEQDPIYYTTSSLGSLKPENPMYLSQMVRACRGDTGYKQDVIKFDQLPMRILYPTKSMVLASPSPTCGSIMYQGTYFNQGNPRKVLQDYESNREGLLAHAKILIGVKKGYYLPNSAFHPRPNFSVRGGAPPPSYRAEAERIQNEIKDSSPISSIIDTNPKAVTTSQIAPTHSRVKEPALMTSGNQRTENDVDKPANNIATGFMYIGSANCSESAWGTALVKSGKIRMNNFELGICFPFDKDGNGVGCAQGMKFETPCCIPGRPYGAQEEPWLWWMEHMQIL